MTGFIRRADPRQDIDEHCDVCVIGSGAGGAVAAATLAAAGLDVVVLEEGGWWTRADFDLDEAKAYPRLYMGRGAWATEDLGVTILQGRSVGGSTTVNWTTCYRTPQRILRHWAQQWGTVVDQATLDPHWAAVEERLHIQPWPEEAVNANNQVLLRGCRSLGLECHTLRRNVYGCLNSGYCGVGCPVDAKQAMGVTMIPDAVARGARVYADVRVLALESEGGRVTSARGAVLEREADRQTGARVRVQAKNFVLAAGAIGSPALLLRSGLDANGRTGKRTFVHPVIGVGARFAEPVHGYHGAPQSAASHHFVDRGPDKVGYFLETPPVQPMLVSTAHMLIGDEQDGLLRDLPHTSLIIALSIDGLLPQEEGGTVGFKRSGDISLTYRLGPEIQESFRASAETMIRVALAAGAEEVTLQHSAGMRTFRRVEDITQLDALTWGNLQHPIFTAHVMGGCAMGADPKRAVVDPTLRHHATRNLWVIDGSVLPTSLGVNPSLTLYGLARWAATGMLEHLA